MTACPKPRPRLLSKREAQADVRAVDRRENAIVKKRSGGQCEVLEVSSFGLHEAITATVTGLRQRAKRCARRAAHIHHLRSGIGIRNRGVSITAACKLHICELHHDELHGHVITPESNVTRYDAARVRFTRVR